MPEHKEIKMGNLDEEIEKAISGGIVDATNDYMEKRDKRMEQRKKDLDA